MASYTTINSRSTIVSKRIIVHTINANKYRPLDFIAVNLTVVDLDNELYPNSACTGSCVLLRIICMRSLQRLPEELV